jgi:hypothetical protein
MRLDLFTHTAVEDDVMSLVNYVDNFENTYIVNFITYISNSIIR